MDNENKNTLLENEDNKITDDIGKCEIDIHETLEDEGYTDGVEVISESVKREQEIEYRLGEIAVAIDEYQRLMYEEDTISLTDEEYQDLLNEQKELHKELRMVRKTRKDTFWDKLKTWQLIYGIVQVIVCLPFFGLLYQLTYALYAKLDEWFSGSLSNFPDGFQFAMQILMMLAFPIINLFISWIVYANVVDNKNKFDKKCFIVIWIVQFVLTAVSMALIFI